MRKGVPMQYIIYHQWTKERTDFSDAVPFKIDGIPCKLIQLTKGQYAIVLADHHLRLNTRNWSASWSRTLNGHYAVSAGPIVGGKQTMIYMHREVMGVGIDDDIEVDHIDSLKTLDNRPCNLRTASHRENIYNQKLRSDNTSGFKGVHFRDDKKKKKWEGKITAMGKVVSFGYFYTAEEANTKVCEERRKLHGKFARDK